MKKCTENQRKTKHIHVTASAKGTHLGEAGFGVRAVVREIWVLFVLLGEALLYRDLIDLW